MQQKNVGGKILQDGDGGYFSKQPGHRQQSVQHRTPLSPPQLSYNVAQRLKNTEIFRKIRKIADKYWTILTNIESLDNSQSKSNTQPFFLPLSWLTMLHIYWKMLKFSVKYEKLLTNTERYWQILKAWTTVSPSPTSNPSFSPQFLSWWRTLLHFGTGKFFARVKVYTDLTTQDKLNATCNMAWQLSYVTFYGP